MGLPVKIGIVAFGLLVVAAGVEAYVHRVPPAEVEAAQTAVSRDIAKRVLEAFPGPQRWTSLAIADVAPNSFRFTLLYAPESATQAEIAADAVAVAQQMLLRLAMASRHPSDEGTEIVVVAFERAADGGAGRNLGAARFDPPHDRVWFDPTGR